MQIPPKLPKNYADKLFRAIWLSIYRSLSSSQLAKTVAHRNMIWPPTYISLPFGRLATTATLKSITHWLILNQHLLHLKVTRPLPSVFRLN